MTLRLPESSAWLLTCLCVALALTGVGAQVGDTPPPLGVATPTPSPEASLPPPPTATPRGGKKAPRVRAPKEIPFPLPIGNHGHDIKFPQMDGAGNIIQQLLSMDIKRLDNEHVEMHETKVDLFHADGKEDFHVLLPDSILNLKTQIISSDHPVTVRTEDFELTGEKMEFNTVDRTGELLGHVHMVIHNFKQVAGVIPAAPAR